MCGLHLRGFFKRNDFSAKSNICRISKWLTLIAQSAHVQKISNHSEQTHIHTYLRWCKVPCRCRVERKRDRSSKNNLRRKKRKKNIENKQKINKKEMRRENKNVEIKKRNQCKRMAK